MRCSTRLLVGAGRQVEIGDLGIQLGERDFLAIDDGDDLTFGLLLAGGQGEQGNGRERNKRNAPQLRHQ
jgi:hypothetical protein